MSSTSHPPTPQQQQVLDCEAAHVVVSAAAGSGKTKVLVDLYLRYVIEKGLSPDQILTITFTKKAAAEMKSRIVRRLREGGRFDDAQVAETGPIQTIHGFCERFLRENAIEAGLDPEFDVLSEQATARAKDRCIKRALALADDECAQELMLSAAGKMAGGSQRSKAYHLLERAALRMLEGARDGGLTRSDFEDAFADPCEVLARWRLNLAAECPEPPASPGIDSDFIGTLREAYRVAKHREPNYLKGKWSPALEMLAARRTCGLAAIAAIAWREFDRFIDRSQSLDFGELEARAVRLLESSAHVRERLAGSYKALMIDETQDVNPVQYRLIDRLQVARKLMVGDHRQSIFAFRGADSRLFIEQADKAKKIPLTENHRSEPGIINFVNEVYRSIWPDHEAMKPYGKSGAGFTGVEVWKQRMASPSTVALAIKEMVDAGEPKGEIAALVRGFPYGVQLHERLNRLGVTAVLVGGTERFYVRLEVRDVANVLRALTDPADDFSLLAVLRSPFARFSLDAIALLGLRAPVSQLLADRAELRLPSAEDRESLDRFCAWFLPLSRYADRLPAWEVLAEMLAKSRFLEGLARGVHGEQQIANVRKLLSLAVEQPELGPAEFAEQIWEIQQLEHREGDAPIVDEAADVVRIMTIHKAKGLQFPVVVVPDLHGSLDGRSQPVEIDPRIGMAAARFDGPNPYHAFLAHRRYDRERAEEERLLYVALTRAQRRLCVVAHPNTAKLTLAKLVARNIDLEKAATQGLIVKNLDAVTE